MKTEKKILKNTAIYRKTPKGVLTNIYAHQLSRSRERNIEYPTYTLQELHILFLNDIKFLRIHKERIKSGCKKQMKPSIDRINNKKWYSINNITIKTWAENRFKQTMERRCRKGGVIQLLNGKEIKKYKSQREAIIETGFNQSQMSKVLNGKGQTCGGYEWIYETNLLNNETN